MPSARARRQACHEPGGGLARGGASSRRLRIHRLPILASPLFAVRRYRNFEVHRLSTSVHLVGFVTEAEAAQLGHPTGDTVITVQIYPDAERHATAIVSIPYGRIAQHRQYAIRNAEAISLQVVTADALSA